MKDRELDEGKYSRREIADRIGADFENIASAWYWALESRHLDHLMKMGVPIWGFVFLRQHRYQATIRLYREALATLDENESAAIRKLYGHLLTYVTGH